MPDQNNAALDFLLTRQSRPAKTFTLPVPSRDESVSYTHLTLPTTPYV